MVSLYRDPKGGDVLAQAGSSDVTFSNKASKSEVSTTNADQQEVMVLKGEIAELKELVTKLKKERISVQ